MQEKTILWGKYQRLGEVFCNRVVPCMRSYSPVQGKPLLPLPSSASYVQTVLKCLLLTFLIVTQMFRGNSEKKA